jgi:hypothetical protein
MLSFITRADVEAAIQNTALDPNLRNLLAIRAMQLEDDTEPEIELGDLAHFHAVEAGDGMIEVEAALGFAIDINLVDGIAFGHSDFIPSWEWIEHHVGYFELAFIFSDDGFGHVLFVPDQHDIDSRLVALCRSHLTTV